MGAAARVAPLAAPALYVPAAIADWADAQLAGLPVRDVTAAQLLTERAAISGYVSRGLISPGGSCRLLEAADGWLALNLARDEDWELLAAWLECDVARDWESVAVAVRGRGARALVERGREIGLAVALEEDPPNAVGGPSGPTGSGLKPLPQRIPDPPRVIDLSSLWAGPLAGHLLHRAGAEVVKVESLRRPDGARRGPALFFDLLNAGKASVALDFASSEGRAQLRALVDSADIVIEASRPRALRQLGIDAESLVAQRPGLVWVSITAYGRAAPTENWIGYGDDVAVAAGLTAAVRRATGVRQIVGDAIADPLTGIRAARVAWDAWQRGAGGVLDVSLLDTARAAMNKWGHSPITTVANGNWGVSPISKPLIRQASGMARELGADTVVQLREAAKRRGRETAGAAGGECP